MFTEEKNKKLTLFITIDTEDKFFDVPRLITGEGLDNRPGIYLIMDLLKKYNCNANFFLNVYEHVNYQPGVLERIAREIAAKGHEIELHTHFNEKLDFYNKPIYKYSLEEQIEILKYGKELIYQWTGKNPIAHRGGSYALNEDTFLALNKIGIPMDSSYWYNNPNNRLKDKFTINKAALYNNILEIPITYVDRIKSNGERSASKFDIDWLSLEEMIQVIHLAKEHHLRIMTLFFHSFSLISKKSKSISEAVNPQALFVSKPHRNDYTEIYGAKPKYLEVLDKILNYISTDEDIEILLFKEWYKKGMDLSLWGDEFTPVVG